VALALEASRERFFRMSTKAAPWTNKLEASSWFFRKA